MRWFAAVLFAAPYVNAVQLTEKCFMALDLLVNDNNMTFWSRRAEKQCKIKFQNGIQNACGSTGVVPLLMKRNVLGHESTAKYEGWTARYRKPAEFAATWTPIPTSIPTPMPSPQPVPPPTPRLTPPPTPAPPVEAGTITDLSVLPVTPKPTPFGEIKPPPLPEEIAILAAPSGVAFALSGNLEGGIDLSGSGQQPPAKQEPKICSMNQEVNCESLPRKNLCNSYFSSEDGRAKSCTLRTKPLLDYEAWSTKETMSARERSILNSLQTLVVIEDFCLPAECDLVESDRTALLFAFFQDPRSGRGPGGKKYQSYGDKQMELTCNAAEGSVGLAVIGSVTTLFCFFMFWFLMKPPKMAREYKIQRKGIENK
jgi:hypothetical protein